jgi:hypothetical protein
VRKFIIGAASLALLCGGVALAAPSQAVPGTTIPGDGTYVVGVDLQPGVYRSQGSDSCYWKRLSGFSGSLHDIIANNLASGPQVVQIAATDAAFVTERCGTWTLTSAAGGAPWAAPNPPVAPMRPPVAPAPPATPPRGGVDLNVGIPVSYPTCDGTGIVVLGNAVSPGSYKADVQRLLADNPGASYPRTDQSCPSLRQATETGSPIYAVFRVAGRTPPEVCSAVRAAGGNAYGKWLDTAADPSYVIPC